MHGSPHCESERDPHQASASPQRKPASRIPVMVTATTYLNSTLRTVGGLLPAQGLVVQQQAARRLLVEWQLPFARLMPVDRRLDSCPRLRTSRLELELG